MCSFANATGGIVLIGVDDSGEIHSVKSPNKLKSEIQSVARSIDPPLIIDIEFLEGVLIVQVPAQNSKPYSCTWKFYLREGATSQQLSRDEIREFFLRKASFILMKWIMKNLILIKIFQMMFLKYFLPGLKFRRIAT